MGCSPWDRKDSDRTEQLHFTLLYFYTVGGSDSKASTRNAETMVQSLGREDPLEKETAIHSSILAWEIPWTEEPGGLQFMGSQRAGHT